MHTEIRSVPLLGPLPADLYQAPAIKLPAVPVTQSAHMAGNRLTRWASPPQDINGISTKNFYFSPEEQAAYFSPGDLGNSQDDVLEERAKALKAEFEHLQV